MQLFVVGNYNSGLCIAGAVFLYLDSKLSAFFYGLSHHGKGSEIENWPSGIVQFAGSIPALGRSSPSRNLQTGQSVLCEGPPLPKKIESL
jgi:hypothetical protein